MLKRFFYPMVFVFSGNTLATGTGGFNELQLDSEIFVRATCAGLSGGTTPLERDLATACGSMVQTVNGSGANNDRLLTNEESAAGFQNLVSEETLAPISIAANTSSLGLSAINSRLAKIRFGTGAGDDLFSGSRLGFFINGMGGFGETDQTTLQDASDFETKGVISGFDFKITENLIVGLAGSYSNFELEFDKNTDVAGGGIDSDSYSITAYSNYAIGNGYIEGVFTYGWSEYDINRSIFIATRSTTVSEERRAANANPDGEQLSASLAGGYDLYTGSFNYGPYARIAYFESEIDGYDETGAQGLNLRVGEHESDSLETVLGVQMSRAFSYSFGVLVPHVKAEWHHEFMNDTRSFEMIYVNDPNDNIYLSKTGDPERNFYNVSAGLSADLKYGFQTFIDYETILGINDIAAHKFSAGVRMEF